MPRPVRVLALLLVLSGLVAVAAAFAPMAFRPPPCQLVEPPDTYIPDAPVYYPAPLGGGPYTSVKFRTQLQAICKRIQASEETECSYGVWQAVWYFPPGTTPPAAGDAQPSFAPLVQSCTNRTVSCPPSGETKGTSVAELTVDTSHLGTPAVQLLSGNYVYRIYLYAGGCSANSNAQPAGSNLINRQLTFLVP